MTGYFLVVESYMGGVGPTLRFPIFRSHVAMLPSCRSGQRYLQGTCAIPLQPSQGEGIDVDQQWSASK